MQLGVSLANEQLSGQRDIEESPVEVEVCARHICIDGVELDFDERRLAGRLLERLYLAGRYGVDGDELIDWVYGERDWHMMSKRYQAALRHRLVKLISRTRLWLEKSFTDVTPQSLTWLPCDRSGKASRWFLTRFDCEVRGVHYGSCLESARGIERRIELV